jgi:LmbE family N-acetylglucosaminyl deacetylase
MQLTDLGQIQDTYDHIYLSPHLDDAALSCGGAIAQHSSAGARVLVVTICTASSDGPFNALALDFHSHWGLEPAEAVSARLSEDELAMERLGADYYWAGMLDAIYRLPDAYDSRERLFGTPVADDPLYDSLRQLIGELRARSPRANFYAPLGVGSHVDHLITYAAALETVGTLAFYEDIPYVLHEGALQRRLSDMTSPCPCVTSIIPIDSTLARKIGAIELYASQLGELFRGPATMAEEITAYAEGLRPEDYTYGERLWIWDAQAAGQP